MRYIFENEIALELYYTITKTLEIEMTPGDGFGDEVYLSEDFLMESLTEIYKLKELKKIK